MKLDGGDEESAKLSLVRSVNTLYVNPSLSASASASSSSSTSASTSNSQSQGVVHAATAPHLHPIPASGGGGSMLDWSVHINIRKYELEGQSFTVFIFLASNADVPSNPTEWFTTPAFVGEHSVFANSVPGQCANCQRQREAGLVTEGVVHLNHALVGKVTSYDPDDVQPFLRDNLNWRVQKVSSCVQSFLATRGR